MNLKGSVSVSDMRIALRFTPIKSLDEVNTKGFYVIYRQPEQS